MIFTQEVHRKRKCVHRAVGPKWISVGKAKKWCLDQRSHGHFYESGTFQGDWWFEFERDALLFSLKWSSQHTGRLVIDIETNLNAPINHIEYSVVVKSEIR